MHRKIKLWFLHWNASIPPILPQLIWCRAVSRTRLVFKQRCWDTNPLQWKIFITNRIWWKRNKVSYLINNIQSTIFNFIITNFTLEFYTKYLNAYVYFFRSRTMNRLIGCVFLLCVLTTAISDSASIRWGIEWVCLNTIIWQFWNRQSFINCKNHLFEIV